MKIDPQNPVDQAYSSMVRNTSSISSHDAVERDVNLKKDRIELSSDASKRDIVSDLREKVLSDVEKGTSPDRLRELKASIDKGTYYVKAEDIAKAILGKN